MNCSKACFLIVLCQFYISFEETGPRGEITKKYLVEIPCISSPDKNNKHAPLKYQRKT